MARRLSPKHDEATRAKIQTSQLINRLQKFALSDGSDGVEMDNTRLRAIEVLLKKTLPDLQAVQHSGTGEDGEIEHSVGITVRHV